jgi:hypothetical protein
MVGTIVFVLVLVAFVAFALGAAGVVNARVQLVPLGLAAAALAGVIRLWPG